jgi:mono/diheme cytochrome c family protein
MSFARRLLLVIVALAVTGAAVFWILTLPQTIAASALPQRTADLANGEVMFNAGGCANCHAGSDGDRKRLGGGLALKSPFGTFHVPNISPDPRAGIGAWSEANFVTAMLRGTSPDGRNYYPAFPYTSYQRMRIEDVRDLFAYLKTLPAVQGRARDHELPFPFNIRRGVGLWKLAFANAETFRPDPSKSPQWNRGAYLVNGPGHCAECHSPRNVAGAIVESRRFAGGPNPEGEGFIPNITQAKLGDWSEADFVTLLDTGQVPSFDSVSGAMEAVVKSTSQLPAADREAMAAYLKSLAPIN